MQLIDCLYLYTKYVTPQLTLHTSYNRVADLWQCETNQNPQERGSKYTNTQIYYNTTDTNIIVNEQTELDRQEKSKVSCKQ